MAINRNRPDNWKRDILLSVDHYNSWFMEYAPIAFRNNRINAANYVISAFEHTDNLRQVSPAVLTEKPDILPILRMATCPPIARDRLSGLARVGRNLIDQMEDSVNPRVPPRMSADCLQQQLEQIIRIFRKMADPDILVWFPDNRAGTETEVERAATIIADRLCGAITDPIIRNAQEQRQLGCIKQYLEQKNYRLLDPKDKRSFREMEAGTFSFRKNIPVRISPQDSRVVNMPIDVIIKPHGSSSRDFPILFEAKSAGDFANVNKRRKEEAVKIQQLRTTYGEHVQLNLFLCGYFDCGYLGYEAAEGIDWVWEHRITDMDLFGI